MTIVQCLIVAAGRGSRIAPLGDSKPLVPLLGIALIEWVIQGALIAGAETFTVVTGYNADRLEDFLASLSLRLAVPIVTVRNENWPLGNGFSVLQARSALEANPFALMMSDHLFTPSILRDLCAQPLSPGEVMLAVDKEIGGRDRIDIDDVTRVLVDDGSIVNIGKGIARYNAYDTGLFWCSPELFEAVDKCCTEGGESSISAVLRRCGRLARAFGIDGRFWMDIDNAHDLQRAEALLTSTPELVHQ
jgi:choline kinase